MANRRSRIHDFYSTPLNLRAAYLSEKAAAAPAGRFAFHGPAVSETVIARIDLNGYSSWAADKAAAQRATLLDEFFSRLIPALNAAGGVYFRDEGDCIVALFSDYFGGGWTYTSAERFCMNAVAEEYGSPKLTAKAVLGCGKVVIYQKAHEVGSEDWSAEGDPFVRAGRLEAAVPSKPRVTYFRDEYRAHFSTTNVSAPGTPSSWDINYEKLQVQGVGATGGWVDVTVVARKAAEPAVALR